MWEIQMCTLICDLVLHSNNRRLLKIETENNQKRTDTSHFHSNKLLFGCSGGGAGEATPSS